MRSNDEIQAELIAAIVILDEHIASSQNVLHTARLKTLRESLALMQLESASGNQIPAMRGFGVDEAADIARQINTRGIGRISVPLLGLFSAVQIDHS